MLAKRPTFGNQDLTALTIGATFTMGFIDAYTFLEQGAVFASAQTGNMIIFAVKLFEHGWSAAWVNVPVWLGYFLGCFLAQGVMERFASASDRRRNQWFMVVDIAFYLFFSLTQTVVNALWMVFFLGVLAGYELVSFRKIGGTTLNNGIMTGNTKSFATTFYQMVVDHNREARTEFAHLGIAILVFIVGCGSGAMLCLRAPFSVLWTATGIKVLLLAFISLSRE